MKCYGTDSVKNKSYIIADIMRTQKAHLILSIKRIDQLWASYIYVRGRGFIALSYVDILMLNRCLYQNTCDLFHDMVISY